nr:hypothetical protein [Tanacetum cinerariifolium]
MGSHLSRRGREAALMQFHCVGYEPYGFISNSLRRAERMDGTPITKIDIKHGKFLYPEEDREPSASIFDVRFQIGFFLLIDSCSIGKTGEEANQQCMLFLVWSTSSTNPQNKEGDATFDGKEHDDEKPKSTVNLSPSSSALSGEQDDMTKKKDKGKSLVDYFIRSRDFNADFKDYSKDSSNDVTAAGLIVLAAGQNYSNSTNPISIAGLSNTNISPTHGM